MKTFLNAQSKNKKNKGVSQERGKQETKEKVHTHQSQKEFSSDGKGSFYSNSCPPAKKENSPD